MTVRNSVAESRAMPVGNALVCCSHFIAKYSGLRRMTTVVKRG